MMMRRVWMAPHFVFLTFIRHRRREGRGAAALHRGREMDMEITSAISSGFVQKHRRTSREFASVQHVGIVLSSSLWIHEATSPPHSPPLLPSIVFLSVRPPHPFPSLPLSAPQTSVARTRGRASSLQAARSCAFFSPCLANRLLQSIEACLLDLRRRLALSCLRPGVRARKWHSESVRIQSHTCRQPVLLQLKVRRLGSYRELLDDASAPARCLRCSCRPHDARSGRLRLHSPAHCNASGVGRQGC